MYSTVEKKNLEHLDRKTTKMIIMHDGYTLDQIFKDFIFHEVEE